MVPSPMALSPMDYFLQQQSFMEQPQQDEPLFFLRIEEITARVTSAAIAMITMMVAAFIV